MSRLVAAPPPNRVRSPTDRHFASSCSPRRFGPTQLPLATELWHTPARTFTVLMWRPHGRTHSSMERWNPGLHGRFRRHPANLDTGHPCRHDGLFTLMFCRQAKIHETLRGEIFVASD